MTLKCISEFSLEILESSKEIKRPNKKGFHLESDRCILINLESEISMF